MANRRATNIGAARVEVGSWLVALSSDEGLRRAVQVANMAHLSLDDWRPLVPCSDNTLS